MNFASQRVDHGYLKVLIIGKAVIVKVLSEGSAMCNRFCICVELDPNPVSHWNAVFQIEEKCLHLPIPLRDQSGVSALVPNVSLQPRLAVGQHVKRCGDLPVSIALVARRKRPRVAQIIAPQFDKFLDTVASLNERFAVGHGTGLAPFAVQRRVNSRSN
jgi:hypothetical protein